MLRIFFVICFFNILTNCLAQGGFWKDVNDDVFFRAQEADLPSHYRLLHLDLAALKQALQHAPLEVKALHRSTIIELPLPNGEMADFEVVESPVMQPWLASRYPMIKTYLGHSRTPGVGNVRFDITPAGFHASIATQAGTVYINTTESPEIYRCFYPKDLPDAGGWLDETISFCGVPEHALQQATRQYVETSNKSAGFRNSENLELRVYRIALAATGEYSQMKGGTVTSVLAEMTTVLNRVNQIFERELAIRFIMIDSTEKLIFLDPATDPWSDGRNTPQVLSENLAAIGNQISNSHYDIGHTFTRCPVGGGVLGIASLRAVCTDFKANGVSCQYPTSSNDFFAINIVCHEIGHQFGATHSFNNCGREENISTGYEPGGGSTIMSYFNCPGNNIQPVNDDYFHVGSLDQMIFYSRQNDGNSCPVRLPIENSAPEAIILLQNGFVIPINTTFELEGLAVDPDGDQLTYNWEEYDVGPQSSLGNPVGNAPIFRSFPPDSSPKRSFPKLDKIINQNFDGTEVLPSYSRDLTFRFTVRDNNVLGGGVDWAQIKFKSSALAGPFLVTQPDSAFAGWEIGQFREVTWNVANTDQNPVNSSRVNILLSLDGGFTYPITLASNTRNDGSEFVTVPDTITSRARIKIKAADNIFFDISDQDFQLKPASTPGYGLALSANFKKVCTPGTVEFDIITQSLLNFDSLIHLSIIDGLPNGSSAEFSVNPVRAGQSSRLNLSFQSPTEVDTFFITVQAVAATNDTAFRQIEIVRLLNDFSQFAAIHPADGTSGLQSFSEFSWTRIPAATGYDIEIATSPAFGNTVVAAKKNLAAASYVPDLPLLNNTLYYWRVRPTNDCGVGSYTPIMAFHTESLSCTNFEATDVPINISATGTPTINSVIPVVQDFLINDLNIPQIKGNHDLVKHLDVKLRSPSGTEIILFSNICGNTTTFNIGLDDEALDSIPCPPNDQQQHRPQNPLSLFNGENGQGDWILEVRVNNSFGEGGALEAWQLELCTNVNLSNPSLIINDTIPLNPLMARVITNEFLLVQDDENTAAELIYTVVTNVSKGKLLRNNSVLQVGDQFTQQDLNSNRISYQHEGDGPIDEDHFDFTVIDGEGGWLGTLRFVIAIDSGFVVGTKELPDNGKISVFPNPATDELHIGYSGTRSQDVDLIVHDVQGRVLLHRSGLVLSEKISIALNDWNSGVYILQVRGQNDIFIKRFVVAK